MLAALGTDAVHLFVCRQNTYTRFSKKTKRFGAMVSLDDLYEILHGHFNEPAIGPLKFNMAEIRHLENRQIAIFQRKIVRFRRN